MNTKLNFLKHAITSIENNDEYMAHTLKKYREFEQLPESELLQLLNCSMNDYYKLALCKLPKTGEADYQQRLETIGTYTNIDATKLFKIIKHVQTILKFTTNPGSMLLAARDKDGKNKKK